LQIDRFSTRACCAIASIWNDIQKQRVLALPKIRAICKSNRINSTRLGSLTPQLLDYGIQSEDEVLCGISRATIGEPFA